MYHHGPVRVGPFGPVYHRAPGPYVVGPYGPVRVVRNVVNTAQPTTVAAEAPVQQAPVEVVDDGAMAEEVPVATEEAPVIEGDVPPPAPAPAPAQPAPVAQTSTTSSRVYRPLAGPFGTTVVPTPFGGRIVRTVGPLGPRRVGPAYIGPVSALFNHF